jgi:hypothetical protein
VRAVVEVAAEARGRSRCGGRWAGSGVRTSTPCRLLAMPRSSKKPKRAGKAEKKEKKKDTKKPKSAGEIKQAKPLDFEGLKDANDVSTR